MGSSGAETVYVGRRGNDCAYGQQWGQTRCMWAGTVHEDSSGCIDSECGKRQCMWVAVRAETVHLGSDGVGQRS